MARPFAFTAAIVCSVLLVGLLVLALACQPDRKSRVGSADEPFILSGPYGHEHLEVFLVHQKEPQRKTSDGKKDPAPSEGIRVWANAREQASVKTGSEAGEEFARPADAYLNHFKEIVSGKDDVIGSVVVINGRIRWADLYSAPASFRKQWFSNVRLAVRAALAEGNADGEIATVSREDVMKFLATARRAPAPQVPAKDEAMSLDRR